MSIKNKDFLVTHIVKRSLKNIYLRVSKEDGLIIKSPKISKSYLNQIIEEKRGWAIKRLEELENKESFLDNSNSFLPNSNILYLGKKYPFEIIISRRQSTQIEFKDNIFQILTTKKQQKNIKLFIKKLDEFYKIESKRIIPNIVDEYSTDFKKVRNHF